ncbi:caspase domain-containing protein [Marinobacter pelagius]|uniref:Caspase domain-containing protein n=1 Tax=Marinobacter pelagius TaxID=379482 RepID=A0A366GMG4_9GAMM|nr:caspase family protein [Marinobacter pelagius]RBP28504.1 caspase domain-containing protein [Marinobacter pelagius]
MSQNIAILIGNTKYDELSTLNCCANDVHQMRELLLATKKFSRILDYIDKPVDLVKDEIRELAESGEGFEEVFLYFSGHGLSNSDDFFMCFSDFKESSPNTTGLSRNDAFELIRQFQAELSVVVIDACEAGRNLIKNHVTPLSYTLKNKFSNFVQFSSCTEGQFSLAGDRISLFTYEFIKACLNKEKGPVYYSDVESALRDAFLGHSSQTPHFIRQGTSQEKFCADAAHLRDFREAFLVAPASDNNQLVSPPATEFALAKEAIKEMESLIPTMDKAQEFINGVFEHTLSASGKTPEINELFDIRTVKYDDFELVQNKRSVIDLLTRRGGSDSFVESDVEKTKRRRPFGISTALAALTSEDEYDTTYNILNHSKLKSVHVGIYFEPKSIALNRVFSEIVFLPRLTECLILTCNSYEKRSSWDSFNEFDGTKKWKWSHHSWFDDPSEVAEDYVSDPYSFTKKYVFSFSEGNT